MPSLHLPKCPICQAEGSLSRETMQRADASFIWYECRECGSVLLWTGEERWAYQKVGREDKAHLLKQPMSAHELAILLPADRETPGESQPTGVAPEAEKEEPNGGASLKKGDRGKPTRLLAVGVAVAVLVLFIGVFLLLGNALNLPWNLASLWEPTPTPTPGVPRFAPGDEVVIPYQKTLSIWALTEDGSTREHLTFLAVNTRPAVITVMDVRGYGAEWYCYVPTPKGDGWIKEEDLMTPAEHDQYLTEYFAARERDANIQAATADARERGLYGPLVEYYVGGTASRVSITMANESGGTEQFQYGTPYRATFRRQSGLLYISAQNQTDSGSVTCKITVDGRVIEEAKSSGAYVIATCSGSVP